MRSLHSVCFVGGSHMLVRPFASFISETPLRSSIKFATRDLKYMLADKVLVCMTQY
jgi:hypothetical protein